MVIRGGHGFRVAGRVLKNEFIEERFFGGVIVFLGKRACLCAVYEEMDAGKEGLSLAQVCVLSMRKWTLDAHTMGLLLEGSKRGGQILL